MEKHGGGKSKASGGTKRGERRGSAMKVNVRVCATVLAGVVQVYRVSRKKGMAIAGLLFLPLFLVASSADAYTYTVLYTFTGGADGGVPIAGLTRDPSGNLYGTTLMGGTSGAGVVFKLTPGGESPASGWTEIPTSVSQTRWA
jgi:uncharacterized repeat protein (TIGR03803 family)